MGCQGSAAFELSMCSLLLGTAASQAGHCWECYHACCFCLRLQLCAGHIRVKNNRNILLKNLLDCAVGTVSWFLIG